MTSGLAYGIARTAVTLAALGTVHPAMAATLAVTSMDVLGEPRTYLTLEGDIVEGDWWQFTKAMRANPSISGVLLSSDGGSLDDGLAIAKHIYSHGLDTMVTSACHSVCAIMFLAGKARYMAADASLSVHSAYRQLGDWIVEDDQANIRVAWFIGQMGYPLKLAEIWSSTRSNASAPISTEMNDKLKLGLSYFGTLAQK